MNFNKYICSVIALSLINPSNFWGAVHGAECGAWSFEADGASKMRPSFLILILISHFSFSISHFPFFISHFRFPRVSAFRQTPPSTRLGNRGQSCLSTDRRRADFPDLTPTQPGRLHASPHCRFVKLSGLGRKASEKH